MTTVMTQIAAGNPFDLTDDAAYACWRAWKLERKADDAVAVMVNIADPMSLQTIEKDKIVELADTHNMVIYQVTDNSLTEKKLVHELGKSIGLIQLDNNLRADEGSVTSLEVRAQQGNQYIPYTNKRLSWHTDGYYNHLDRQIRGIIMHCVQPSAAGGENAMIDHELMYIRLRDEDPEYIKALMHPKAMTIPANEEGGLEIRATQAGPVFSLDTDSGSLHMRYSARQRNIEWREDEITHDAVAAITELLQDDSIVCRVRLRAGQGIICNNVLHNRTAFEDSDEQKRLMYRARYYDRVSAI